MQVDTMLSEIIENKKKEIELLKEQNGQQLITDAIEKTENIRPRGFITALKSRNQEGRTAVIAEIKKHSPSKGDFGLLPSVIDVARIYETSGATCISVLTDEVFFKGSLEDLRNVKSVTTIPIIRKDFILDEIQIYESKLAGADCILLILACLPKQKYHDLLTLSHSLNMDVLVEVHDKVELEVALDSGADLVGINNRNLNNFEVNIQTSISLAKYVTQKKTILISESGITDRSTILELQNNRINGFLIGESLITSKNISEHLNSLIGE